MDSQDLLEREAELGLIRDALATAKSGAGSLFVVEGPPGIGKTRLLSEVRDAAQQEGFRVLAARASEFERDYAFGVVRQLFEITLGRMDSPVRDAMLAGPAVHAIEVFSATGASEPPAGDFAVLHGLLWLTINMCEQGPVCLLVDDLQWCDVPSLRFLAYLMPRLEDVGLLTVAGLRAREVSTDKRLLHQITTDPAMQVVQLAPLTSDATGVLLRQALAISAEPAFISACHRATTGNPLLLKHLAASIVAENVAPVSANVAAVAEIGPRAVTSLVSMKMAQVSSRCVAIAQTVAILGDNAALDLVAGLVAEEPRVVAQEAAELEHLEILTVDHADVMPAYSFAHPLIGAAVSGSITLAESAMMHARAARVLAGRGAEPHQVAAHLMRVSPDGDQQAVSVLWDAAAEATRKGAPEAACAYLRRCLAEPPEGAQRLQVLVELGRAASEVDLQEAAGYVQQAYDEISNPVARVEIASALAGIYTFLLKQDQALVLVTEVMERLPASAEDERRRLQAELLAALYNQQQIDFSEQVATLSKLPPHDSVGARRLDCVIAYHEMAECDPAAKPRAHSALADGSVVANEDGSDLGLGLGWSVLLAAGDDLAMDSIQAALERAHHNGSIRALWGAYTFRANAWLRQGQLSECVSDAKEGLRLARLGGITQGVLLSASHLADAFMEQGRLREAEQVLLDAGINRDLRDAADDWRGDHDLWARLLRNLGDTEAALQMALATGQSWLNSKYKNPEFVWWRSEAALCYLALGEPVKAEVLIAEDLQSADAWGGAAALGRTLRLSGLLHKGDTGLEHLHQAVTVLETSSARLEHAKALCEFGAALRRSGRRTASRAPLSRALEIASQCGAVPLAARARDELLASGARPRRNGLTGPSSLTPSELRVARMAADQATNRQIAQALFVTPKTVEVQLSSVYHKLGIKGRTDLQRALVSG